MEIGHDDLDNFLDYVDHVFEMDDDIDNAYLPIERVVFRDQENPIEALSAPEFVQRYHISKDNVMHVVLPLIIRNHESRRGLPIPDILKLTTFLRYLSSGSFQLTCGDLSKISQPSVSNIIGEIADRLSDFTHEFVKFPTNDELREVHRKFFNIRGFPGVSGVIDCTHVEINSPGGENAEVFRNRKGYFSLNVQFVAGPDMEFYDVVCRWPGSAHDTRIFDSSYVKTRFEEGNIRGHLLGDSGYPQRGYLYTPILNPVSLAEHAYNGALKPTRITVERAFGILKRKFPILSRKLQNNLDRSMNIILCCSILHNITRLENIMYDVDQARMEEEPDVDRVPDHAFGRQIRNEFINRFFRA